MSSSNRELLGKAVNLLVHVRPETDRDVVVRALSGPEVGLAIQDPGTIKDLDQIAEQRAPLVRKKNVVVLLDRFQIPPRPKGPNSAK